MIGSPHNHWIIPHNDWITPQPLDHFPTMITSPHNHWIISPQWLYHPTTIVSFPHNDWITQQPLGHFPTIIGSPHDHWIISPQWLDHPKTIDNFPTMIGSLYSTTLGLNSTTLGLYFTPMILATPPFFRKGLQIPMTGSNDWPLKFGELVFKNLQNMNIKILKTANSHWKRVRLNFR